MPHTFHKPAYTHGQLIQFLKNKNLSVSDEEYATHCLRYIGYYRLKIYMRPLEEADKNFRPGVAFEDIVKLYSFDRRLRLVCLDAIERIEVALRALIVDVMSQHGGPHFYYNEHYFYNASRVTDLRKVGENGRHLSIKHYKNTYKEPALPPIWCLAEETTFGKLSIVYSDLELPYRKEIARHFGVDEKVLRSWLKSLTDLRNICAHHGRLWNADLVINTPRIAKKYKSDLAQNTSLYARIVLIKVLLESVDAYDEHGWLDSLKEVIESRPATATLSQMGFPEDWKERSVFLS